MAHIHGNVRDGGVWVRARKSVEAADQWAPRRGD
jgi:hypothetical protein